MYVIGHEFDLEPWSKGDGVTEMLMPATHPPTPPPPLHTLTKINAFELTLREQPVKFQPSSLLVSLRYLFT